MLPSLRYPMTDVVFRLGLWSGRVAVVLIAYTSALPVSSQKIKSALIEHQREVEAAKEAKLAYETRIKQVGDGGYHYNGVTFTFGSVSLVPGAIVSHTHNVCPDP